MGVRAVICGEHGCFGVAEVKPGVSKFLIGLSLVFFGIGLFHIGWAVWPSSTDAVQFTIPEGVLPGAPTGAGYASLADYALSISWPRWFRLGDSGSIHVFLTPTAEPDIQPEVQAVQIVMIEMAAKNLQIEPAGRTQYNIAPDSDLTVIRSVNASQQGEFDAKVLVSFGFYDEANNEVVPIPVAVVDIDIRVIDLWGAGSGLALWFGFVGLALWGVFFLWGRFLQAR